MAFRDLNKEIVNCRKCRLWQTAIQAVPGEGPQCAEMMLVGQNPGEEENKTGRPFVGRSGKFLNKVLAQNGLNREDMFITSIVKHATPANRKPFQDEIEACIPYLKRQILLIKPKKIVLMGTVAWGSPRVNDVKYFETVHPSAAMRFTKMRRRFLADFSTLSQQIR